MRIVVVSQILRACSRGALGGAPLTKAPRVCKHTRRNRPPRPTRDRFTRDFLPFDTELGAAALVPLEPRDASADRDRGELRPSKGDELEAGGEVQARFRAAPSADGKDGAREAADAERAGKGSITPNAGPTESSNRGEGRSAIVAAR